MAIFDNLKTVDDLAEILPKMSLVKQGLLGKPHGADARDRRSSRHAGADLRYLLAAQQGRCSQDSSGSIHEGGHLGRQVKVWPDPVIFKQVIIPWLVRTLEPEPSKEVH